MQRAGVPTVPGSYGLVADETAALDIARKIGYPVMIKATAGGGGRGMRLVQSESELVKLWQAAQGEAEAAFGNAGVYIEKFIENPRHIEFQILADTQGNVIGITSFIQIAPHSPGFAIPSNYARQVVQEIIQNGYVFRPSLGIIITKPAMPTQDIFSLFAMEHELNTHQEDIGVYIHSVRPNSPASRANLQEGDLIITINQKEIMNPVDFIREIRTKPAGTRFDLEIKNPYDGSVRTVSVNSESTKSIKSN